MYTLQSSGTLELGPFPVGKTIVGCWWLYTKIDEMYTLQSSGTLELDPLPVGNSIVGCWWSLKLVVMVALIIINLVGLPKDIHKFTDKITPILSLLSIR